MNRVKGRIVSCLATLGVFLSIEAPAKVKDEVWTHPDLKHEAPLEIAVMPVITFTGDGRAGRIVETDWMNVFHGSRHSWIGPDECWKRMGIDARRDSLIEVVRKEVRQQGRLSSATARELARLLSSEALLTLRIDRWERVPESSAGYAVANVRVTAALVNSRGTLLWRSSGRERYRMRYAAAKMREMEWGVEPQMEVARGFEPRFIHADFDTATCRLLTRWRAHFPKPPAVVPSRP